MRAAIWIMLPMLENSSPSIAFAAKLGEKKKKDMRGNAQIAIYVIIFETIDFFSSDFFPIIEGIIAVIKAVEGRVIIIPILKEASKYPNSNSFFPKIRGNSDDEV